MIVGMLAETPIHPGSGRSSGFVDLPVAREPVTSFPTIPGSSMKGSLRSYARTQWRKNGQKDEKKLHRVFGKQENAGALIVSDARLVLLPVRSLTGQYKWATCPLLIERLCRDLWRVTGKEIKDADDLSVPEGKVVGAGSEELFLEELEFEFVEPGNKEEPEEAIARDIRNAISGLIKYKSTSNRLDRQLIMLHDNDFKWFAQYGLAVNARNKLDEEKKTSDNLWYEESLPPDSLFYTIMYERGGKALDQIEDLIKKRPYLQVGGNETVGMGWFALVHKTMG